ncbi:hybrid sensor histidine kinase/response regulator [Desulfosediminicola ganghwensis]|uniref:hybrid sensor histidine kinase/response regulator n=1 Tax=Desulfosediminicola ganghwensis TaxID=2569540 RepID=UPI0010AB50F1|nr:PAS domain-containing sensor histidine kinase [Desulfosediminicola ganghwensis]
MNHIFKSIPFRICASILAIEAMLLFVGGIYFIGYFNRTIDKELSLHLKMPGKLISERHLDNSVFENMALLSGLVGQHVIAAGLADEDGETIAGFIPKEIVSRIDLLPTSEVISVDDGENLALLDHFVVGDQPVIFFIEVSGDRVHAEKKMLCHQFSLWALVILLLSSALEVWAVYRMVVPRIRQTSSVLRKIVEGDFSVRTGATGPPDQLGTMMEHVNMMISTIEAYTVKLKVLNSAAEKFSLARNTEEIIDVATELIEAQLPVRRQNNDRVDYEYNFTGSVGAGRQGGAEDHEIIFTLPIADDEFNYRVVPFVATRYYNGFATVDQDFIATLSRMVTVAVDRVTAFEEISNAESRYRHLFTSAIEGIIRTSPTGRITEMNPAMAAMAGYESIQEMIEEVGKLGEQLYRDPADWVNVCSVLEKSGQLLDCEVEFRRKDGTIFPVSISGNVVRSEHGEVQAYDARIFDISERKRREKAERDHLKAEAVNVAKNKVVDDLEWKNRQLVEALNELKTAQIQLLQSEKMAAVGQTAGGVAHDLNNILSGVVGYPELLLASLPEQSEIRQPIEMILKSGQRAAAIVSDLTALTQGDIREKCALELETLINDVLRSEWFQHFIEDKPGVEVVTAFNEEPTIIFGSPSHMEKMMRNLLANSIFWLKGPGKVRISACTERVHRSIDAEGNEISDSVAVLRVENDGPTISDDDSKNVFEPFYTRKVLGMQGTGLGLTVVWNMVNEHGGSISVDSQKERGTIFTIHLPSDEGAVPHRFEEFPEAGGAAGGRILVIDDEQLQRDIAKRMLERFGYDVKTCQSGEEAVEFLKSRSVDLIILDMLMPPGLNGLETYRRILEIQPQQKAIIVSGYAENKDVQRAMELGAGVYVKKPYTMHQIVQSVNRELQIQRFRADDI